MLEIHDRVCSKKTGLPTVGSVVGLYDAVFFHQSKNSKPYDVWLELYPDYLTKPIVFVKFDKMQKPYSFEEYCKFRNNENLGESDLRVQYQTVPETQYASYPADDLEKI